MPADEAADARETERADTAEDDCCDDACAHWFCAQPVTSVPKSVYLQALLMQSIRMLGHVCAHDPSCCVMHCVQARGGGGQSDAVVQRIADVVEEAELEE